MSWFESLVLGAIQGVTEFLPVSSDGHLNLATNLFAWSRGVPVDGAKALFFDVMLHVGTTLAILLRHRKIGWQGARGLLGATDVADGYRRGPVVRVCLLAVAGTAPLAIDLVLKKKIEAMFEGLWPTAIGFLISAAMLALAARLDRRDLGRKGPAETRYLDAVLIGLAQSLAPLPGGKPQRADGRRGARAGPESRLGRAVQPAAGHPGDRRGDLARASEGRSLVPDRRPDHPDRRGLGAGRRGGLRGDRLAGPGCPVGEVVVFFCIPGPARGDDRRRADRVPRGR